MAIATYKQMKIDKGALFSSGHISGTMKKGNKLF